MVVILNSFVNFSIWYFLHTTITLLAALSASNETKSSCSLDSGCLSRQGHEEFSALVIESFLSRLRYIPQLIL